MSRRAVVKCDRCGDEAEPNALVTIVCGPTHAEHRDPRKLSLPAGWTLLLRPVTGKPPDEFELCGECHAAFAELIRSPHKILTEAVSERP